MIYSSFKLDEHNYLKLNKAYYRHRSLSFVLPSLFLPLLSFLSIFLSASLFRSFSLLIITNIYSWDPHQMTLDY